MKKIAKTYKLPEQLIKDVKSFCDNQGMEYAFFIAKALEEKLKIEEFIQRKKSKYDAS